MVVVKRCCVNPVSAEAFDIFSQKEISESGRNSWCDLLEDSCGWSDLWVCGCVGNFVPSPLSIPRGPM